ncbi:hypothetical protein EDB85DRAFT_2214683 [Lactarius pseudohatsudake]|nr:hypothetical protein EDB85DRAFT_2214683 [Lactarius pseudohatsudake]
MTEDVGIEGGVADDLLQLEFHTDYVGNPEKRRRRWKLRWEALLRAFHALDCKTDTTLVLLAVPSHSGKLHSVASHAICRDNSLIELSDMMNICSTFAKMAACCRASRSSSRRAALSCLDVVPRWIPLEQQRRARGRLPSRAGHRHWQLACPESL